MTVASETTAAKSFAVFYVLDDRFIEAKLEDGSIVHKKGTILMLCERSNFAPSLHHCTYACWEGEPTREYRIDSITVLRGSDPLQLVVDNREWEDVQQQKHNREHLFDTDNLACYLNTRVENLLNPTSRLSGAIIVDLAIDLLVT